MSRTIRGAVLGVALLGALAFAGSAFASFTPKLLVKGAGASGVSVSVSVGNNDDPTAKVSIYVPNGYTVNTAATGKIGDVTATAAAADLGGAVLPLTGELDVIPANAAAQAACGVQTAAATWDLHLTAAGQTLDIPMFLVANAAPESSVGAYKIVVCLPPPDVPPGTPGRATFGAKLLSAVFTSSAITNPASSGDFRWTSLWAPYNPGVGTVNAAGLVEVQSLQKLPAKVVLATKRKRVVTYKFVRRNGKRVRVKVISTRVAFAAGVIANNSPVSGAKVTARINGRSFGTATTGASGIVGGVFTLKKGTATIAVTAVIADQDLGASGCVASPIFQGLPCVDATAGGATLKASAKVTAYTKEGADLEPGSPAGEPGSAAS
jgi:hypothetical protein